MNSAKGHSRQRRRTTVRVALLVLLAGPGPAGMAGPEGSPLTTLPLCVLDVDKMPGNWRPHGTVHASLSQEPWTEAETEEAANAVRSGLAELTEFFESHPKAVVDIGPDTIQSFLDPSYSPENMPDVRDGAREQARRYLDVLLPPYLDRGGRALTCPETPRLVALANYAHQLYPEDNEDRKRIVRLAQAALAKCGELNVDYRRVLAAGPYTPTTTYRFVRYANLLVEAQTIPEINVPRSEIEIVPVIWDYLASYTLSTAKMFDDGAKNRAFVDTAYLVTHAAYIPTGYQRYPIYISDAPWLYVFLRENFYDVLESENLDLISEFVDLFRQYGCTEETDLQTRDGARYLLRLHRAAGKRWMDHRGPGEENKEPHAYALVHKAWTGITGVRRRIPEEPVPGTYGGMFRQLTDLPAPASSKTTPCGDQE